MMPSTGSDWNTPHDGVGLLGQQQIDAHDLDAGFGDGRENAVVICGTVAVQPEYLGDGWAGDIGIQNGDLFAAAAHCDREQRGDKRFSDAALAADDTDHCFDMGPCILRGKQRSALAGGAVFAAGRAIMRAFRHEKNILSLCAVRSLLPLLYPRRSKKQANLKIRHRRKAVLRGGSGKQAICCKQRRKLLRRAFWRGSGAG